MAPTLRSLLALPLALTGASPLGVVDDAGTRTPGIGTVGVTTWVRVLLASTTAAGTATDPFELLTAVTATLGTGWSCTLGSDGRVTIAYAGAVGTLDLTAAPWLYHALGWPTWGGPLDCTGAGQTAPWHPLGCLLTPSREDDRGWQPQPGQLAYALRQDGVVYGYDASDYTLTRTCRLAYLPLDPDVAAQLGSTATPLLPRDRARWRSVPALTPATYAPPYTAHEWLVHARGLPCGAALGTLQALLAGTEQAFDEVYLSPEAMQARDPAAPRVPYIEQYSTRDKVGLVYRQTRARTGRVLLEDGSYLLLEDGSRLLLG